MKIAKKFMALALAAVLSVGCAFCVSADGSRTKDVTVSQEQSQIYEIIQKIEDTEGVKDLQQKYGNVNIPGVVVAVLLLAGMVYMLCKPYHEATKLSVE